MLPPVRTGFFTSAYSGACPPSSVCTGRTRSSEFPSPGSICDPVLAWSVKISSSPPTVTVDQLLPRPSILLTPVVDLLEVLGLWYLLRCRLSRLILTPLVILQNLGMLDLHALSCPSDLGLYLLEHDCHLLCIRGFLLSCVVVVTSQLLRLGLIGAHWLGIGLCLLR